ncbi:DUF5131 family protein [Rhodopila sp.]|uniref:DUF5131 family protein n=1 Tax=Rhodopila sp. TaxID=2480087 RepID=UPI003D0C740E
MADHSLIEWTHATWNPLIGCDVISPGCTNCYAMRLAGTRLKHTPSRSGLTIDSRAGPVWNGTVRFMDGWLHQPLHWCRSRDIFVVAHGDLFHAAVPDPLRDQVFAVMALADWHRFQVLTKRPALMLAYFADLHTKFRIREARYAVLRSSRKHITNASIDWVWPLPQVRLGISAETGGWFHMRLPPLMALRQAGWRCWLSAEPLLGEIGLTEGVGTLEWVVAGGESGPNARPVEANWLRVLRDQCADYGIPFFFKQWGEFREGEHVGKAAAGAVLDGVEHRAVMA